MKRYLEFWLIMLLLAAMAVLCFIIASDLNKVSGRLESTREWLTNLQQVVMVARVSGPCQKCGNTVYNVYQFGPNSCFDGPTPRSCCAKCGRPHADDMKRIHAWFEKDGKAKEKLP